MNTMNRTLALVATVATLVLLVATFLGRGWKDKAGRRQVELEQAQERYTADSAAFEARVAVLEDSLGRLNVVGDSLRAGWAVSREASGAAIITIRNLVAQLPQEHRATVTVALGEIVGAREACDALVANCETRVGAERSGRLEALARLRASDSLRTETYGLWEDAERRARPSFFRDIWRAKAAVLPSLALAGVCLAR